MGKGQTGAELRCWLEMETLPVGTQSFQYLQIEE